jgi:hypothetical protein
MRNAVLVLSLSLVACGGIGFPSDAGTGGGGGSLFTGGGGATGGGATGGGATGGGATGGGATGGGATGGGATGGGGGTSGFEGDTCDNQRTIALTQMGTDYVGSSVSDTSLATANITPTCAQRTKDVVYKVVVPVTGSLHVTVTPHGTGGSVHFDPVISLFTGATCAAATSAACSDSGAIDASETLIQQVQAGPVWIWISGADPSDSGSEFDVNVLLD